MSASGDHQSSGEEARYAFYHLPPKTFPSLETLDMRDRLLKWWGERVRQDRQTWPAEGEEGGLLGSSGEGGFRNRD